MRSHYDFSKMKGRKNPYVKRLKQSVTIPLDRDTEDYLLERSPRFRAMLDKAKRERKSMSLAEYRKSRGV
ncbi:MAG: antitoxin [Planctomycetota bacterium]